MPTDVIKIVDPDNGTGTDYTSLSDAINSEQRNLVTADERLFFLCRSSNGTPDTTNVNINSYTTDATRYIVISGLTDFHNGLWNESKYRLQYNSGSPLLNINVDYTHIVGLQFDIPLISDWQTGIELHGNHSRFYRNIVNIHGQHHWVWGVLGYSDSNTTYIYNNIFINNATFVDSGANVVYNEGSGSGTTYIENNTIIINATSNVWSAGISIEDGNVVARNNILYSPTANFDLYRGTFGSGTDYNVSNQNTQPNAGSNNKVSASLGFVDLNNGNYKLSDTSDARNAGSTLAQVSSGYTDDILGKQRKTSGQIDAGSFEYIETRIPVLVRNNNVVGGVI